MSFSGVIDLCSDDETEALITQEIRPIYTPSLNEERQTFINLYCQPDFVYHPTVLGFEELENPNGFHARDVRGLYANGFVDLSAFSGSMPICRQFWKAGDYGAALPTGSVFHNGHNRLRIHPKFLHSNATSHKWAFGALAELLDNAIDEVRYKASFVTVDKITNMRDGSPALLIQDDGGGMNPDSLRHCMSFGFSNKQADSIGQYGNGFKTSTMRLGADAIVFSRCMDGRNITQSVGLLSYTFLIQTSSDDVIVPMVDYEFDMCTNSFRRSIRHGQRQFDSNLFTLLRWSPFDTEAELLKQFDDLGHHGTKVIVFNLWFNDNGDSELDFNADAEDIMISGAPKAKTKNPVKMSNQTHISTRFRYSLRAYTSILYMFLPAGFKIILRGRAVEPYNIIEDLKFIECIKYKPQVGGNMEILTSVGFLKDAPAISIHGFNVYHKNRLIMPFWPVTNYANGKCKGVAGVLEVNFMKPTHNKQDFERSILYERLESRLREMTVEYWKMHCHLIGFADMDSVPSPGQPFAPHQIQQLRTSNGILPVMFPLSQLPRSGPHGHIRRVTATPAFFVFDVPDADLFTGDSQVPAGNVHTSAGAPSAPTCSSPGQFTSFTDYSQTEVPSKRKHGNHTDAMGSSKKLATPGASAKRLGENETNQPEHKCKGREVRRLTIMVRENKKLQTQCSELEKAEQHLLIQIQARREELVAIQQLNELIQAELKLIDEVKFQT